MFFLKKKKKHHQDRHFDVKSRIMCVLAGNGGQTQLTVSAKSTDLSASMDDLMAQQIQAALTCLHFLFPCKQLYKKKKKTTLVPL